MENTLSFDENGCIIAPVKLYHHYANEVYGAFVVKEISPNNLFITILDSKGKTQKSSYRMFIGSIEMSQESFEDLFKIGCPDSYLRYKRMPSKNLSKEALKMMIEKSYGIGIYGITLMPKGGYC